MSELATPLEAEKSFTADLLTLAAEKSPQKRSELLRRVIDTYLDAGGDGTRAEQYLLNEIVSKLIDKITGPARVDAAVSLAKLPRLPDDVARSLATDQDIAIAAPIVRDHKGLREQILVEVATTGSQDHLLAIASRDHITPPVTDVVVTRGDQRTVQALADNKGAQFSIEGMRMLIKQAEQDNDLYVSIEARNDLTADAVERLQPIISSELARRLGISRDDVDVALVTEHLADWLKDREIHMLETDSRIAAVREGRLALDTAVLGLIERKRLLDAATVIAAMVKLEHQYGYGVLMNGKPYAVMLLFKALELPWRTLSAYLRLRKEKFSTETIDDTIQKYYDMLETATAQRVVRFMHVRRAANAH